MTSEERVTIIYYSHLLFFSHRHTPIPVRAVIHQSSFFSCTVYLWFRWFVCLFDSEEVCHHTKPVKACQEPLSALRVHSHFYKQKLNMGGGEKERKRSKLFMNDCVFDQTLANTNEYFKSHKKASL